MDQGSITCRGISGFDGRDMAPDALQHVGREGGEGNRRLIEERLQLLVVSGREVSLRAMNGRVQDIFEHGRVQEGFDRGPQGEADGIVVGAYSEEPLETVC